MDNKLTENEKCYIVSLDNGIRREEPINISVISSFKDGSQLVQLNSTVFGVYKKNSLNPDTMYIDDFDIIKSDVAELFDVNHEESKRIVDEDGNIGVFTILNYSKDIETRISATTIFKHIIEYINSGVITGQDALWLTKVLQYPVGSSGSSIKNQEQIADIIEIGKYALIKEIEIQGVEPLDQKVKRAIEKNYIRMILFDNLIGRKYRGLDYYLISQINESSKPIWIDAYLAPISVSNSIDKDQNIGDNEYLINNKLVDRESLLKVLFDKYYREIQKLTEAINDAQKLYSDALIRIIYNNTDLNHARILEEMITKNIENIAKSQKNVEIKLDKENKTNKVERTMATQSLNVKVTTKLDLIQKKYPINPKEHPELLKKEKQIQTVDDIRLIVENDNKKANGGFAGTAILISIISIVCGIGLGIAYVLMTFGN